MSKKTKKKGKKLTSKQLQNEIFRLFKRHPKKRFSAKQIIKKLKVANNKDSVNYALEKLGESHKLSPVDEIKFRLNRKNSKKEKPNKALQGYVDMTRTGSAYIVCEGQAQDIYVSAKNLHSALHGDSVRISVFKSRGRRKPEGEVVEVVERAREHFLGTLRIWKNYGLVMPDNFKVPLEIFVPRKDLMDADDGDKVVVKVTQWPDRPNHNPRGVITTVLGAEGSSDIEMKGILINAGFNIQFPEEVLEEAAALPADISKAEVFRRGDMREVTTFTIDPADAKDFDDALSFCYLEDGNREVGIHIADVTHYVKPGTPLDKEAYLRSTSVYLIDRVNPMLPERLSNELCSLRPNEDKCTFSAVFVFDKDNRVVDRWFGKTLIHSDRRFSYEEAQEVIETGKGDFAKEIRELNGIALKLRKDKFKNGAIGFEGDEVKMELDEDGKPVRIYLKERKEAHMLIEDFMLLANREVGMFINKKAKGQEIPFVYRIHDRPDPDKLSEFALFAKQMGFQMDLQTPRKIANSFNRLARLARKDEALKVLEPLAIRTMAKAEYSTNNIGHYGLGFEFYSHFTSPIRRYADVLAHRILHENLRGTFRVDKEKLEQQCRHISNQERRAMDAERESVKYKQVEYMERHVGEEMEGYISGIHDRGLFVEILSTRCEGMIGFETLQDVFELENGRLKAKGIHSGRVFKMGDRVKVRIVDTDLERRTIDMKLVE